MVVSPSSKTTLFLRWRWAVFSSMFIGWSFYLLSRKTLPSSTPSLIQHNGFSKDDIGLIASSFAGSYGTSKFFSSILSDHVSSKKLFSLGLVLSGVGCIVFSLTKSVLVCCVVWFTVGIVQGFGWAPCAILLREWYAPSQIGTWWSILSSAGSLAAAISPVLITELTSVTSWSLSFFTIGISCCVLGLGVFFLIRDSPSELGIETSWGGLKKKDEPIQPPNDTRSQSWYAVFLLKELWLVSAVYAILYLIKHAISNWSQLYFIQEAKKPEIVAAACISMMHIGGMLGNLCTGYISDFFLTPQTEKTKCPRAPVLFGLSLLLTLALHLFASTINEHVSEVWLNTLIFVTGFLIDGLIAIIGLMSMEIVPKKLAGSAHGMACAVAQGGAFLAGWPYAHAVELYGWTTSYYLLEAAGAVMVGIISYLVMLLLRGLAANRAAQKQN